MLTFASSKAMGNCCIVRKSQNLDYFFTPWIFQKENVMFEFSCLIFKVPINLPKKETIHNLSLNKIITTTELD